MMDEETLLARLQGVPGEAALRLVYADWRLLAKIPRECKVTERSR